MASAPSSDDEIDPAQPFSGLVICCTSIPPDQRTDIANKVVELGGIHKYDLTPDATHLIVGDYNTPKYRHVARERPDVRAMAASWIEAVSERWRNDDEDMNLALLEREHTLRPLERCGRGDEGSSSLLICLTGFGGEERDEIARTIVANGAEYAGDLTRRCTHLVAQKPQGQKFTAAKSWNVPTVSLDWLNQSVARGMMLEETKFDPLLPAEEQGLDAWINKDLSAARCSLGKRARKAREKAREEGARKLRKTASMKKLRSQSAAMLWDDIVGRRDKQNTPGVQDKEPPSVAQKGKKDNGDDDDDDDDAPTSFPIEEPAGVFANCLFAIHGFDKVRERVLEETISTLGGTIAPTLEALLSSASSAVQPATKMFLVVPQTSQPDTHPPTGTEKVHVVTEFYMEQCLHRRRLVAPCQQVLGQPFPLFPIPGFESLTICSAAFTGLELSQLSRSVGQLGARFEQNFCPSTSLVVCRHLAAMRREKLRCALEWRVPVVKADWLWDCISTGYYVPIGEYIFPELRRRYVGSDFSTAPLLPSGSSSHNFASTMTTKPTTLDKSIVTHDSAGDRRPSRTHLEPANPTPQQEETTKAKPPSRKDAERQALKSKLTSLIDEPAPSPSPSPSSSHHHHHHHHHHHRRRHLLGRAVSNASSTMSSTTAAAAAASATRPAQSLSPPPPPPATQLEYLDPQAVECKAALVQKMTMSGGVVAVSEDGAAVDVESGSLEEKRVQRRTLRRR
ncbi:hypothetical protein L249_2458 [Ophiocordyceps polyrhachis-furcata BCC 54312]|uniref:BRCT domain-containing protein n=1 Tax=Ophiocordyceps polyrhachis-furcata BCC 54312 TaxID=1330021 RepID=A0A367LPN4_9HYPO|nr:hypothetical protein L249_2458 [Ophiocordyceps polyrhachis-furcata BCC 54312]